MAKNNLDNFSNSLLKTMKTASWSKMINILLFLIILFQFFYIYHLLDRDTVYLTLNKHDVPVRAEEYDYTLVDFVDERKFVNHLLHQFHSWNRHTFEDNLDRLEEILDDRTFDQHLYAVESNDYQEVIEENKISSGIHIKDHGNSRQIGENEFRMTVEAIKSTSVDLVEDEVVIVEYEIDFIKVPISEDNIYGFKATRVIENIQEVIEEGEKDLL